MLETDNPREKLRLYVLASFFSALTAIGAFIKIPFPVVPITLQTLFVILSGALLGPRYGSFSQLLYLAVGLLGVPVFANGGGPGYVMQPTFGYLISYPLAAFVIGKLTFSPQRQGKKMSELFRLFAAICAGMAIIFIIGIFGLYLNLNYVVKKQISLHDATWTGCIVFLPGTFLKIIISIYLIPKIQKLTVGRQA